jgi:hypothetical protein
MVSQEAEVNSIGGIWKDLGGPYVAVGLMVLMSVMLQLVRSKAESNIDKPNTRLRGNRVELIEKILYRCRK